jgi:hypothetical protein
VPGVNRVLRAAGAAAAALALAGCGSPAIPGHGRVAANAAAAPSAAGSAAPSTGSAAPTPGPTATVSGPTATVGKATIPLAGVAKATKQGDYLCLTLTNGTGCSLEIIDIGATRRAGGSVSTPAPGLGQGWWWGSDAASCRNGSDASAVASSTVVDKGYKKIGPKTAVYGSWRVTCQNPALNFDPRLWWLPTSQIAFREHSTAAGSAAAVDKLLAGVTFGA